MAKYQGVSKTEKARLEAEAKRKASIAGILVVTALSIVTCCLYGVLLLPRLFWHRQVFFVPFTSGVVAYLSLWIWYFEINCKTNLLYGVVKTKYQSVCKILNKVLESNSIRQTAVQLCQAETIALGFIDFGCAKLQNIHTGSIICCVGLALSIVSQVMALGYLWWWHAGKRRKQIPKFIAVACQMASILFGVGGIGAFIFFTGDLTDIFFVTPYLGVGGPENTSSFFVGFYLSIVAAIFHIPCPIIVAFMTLSKPVVEKDVLNEEEKKYNEKQALMAAAKAAQQDKELNPTPVSGIPMSTPYGRAYQPIAMHPNYEGGFIAPAYPNMPPNYGGTQNNV